MLAEDPCSLLDPVRDKDRARFRELAQDWDGQNGGTTDGSRCEARLALTLEYRDLVSPSVGRAQWGDLVDGDAQIWDIKSPRSADAIRQSANERAVRAGSDPPALINTSASYRREIELERIVQRQRLDFGIVLDLRRLTPTQAQDLVDGVSSDHRIDRSRVLFFPDDLSPFLGGPE